MVADQRIGHLLGRIAPRLGATLRAVDASDPGEEQPEVVLELGGGAHRRAGGAHGVLLLDGDGRPDVLDAVHVGAVQPLEEHPGIGGERLDVAPLPLREQGVEGQRRLPGTGDPGDHRDPVVGDGDRHVLEVVLAGSFDPEPGGLGHWMDPPEKGSVLEGGGNGQWVAGQFASRYSSNPFTARLALPPAAGNGHLTRSPATLDVQGNTPSKAAPSCLVRLATRPGSEAESTDCRVTDLRRQTLRAVSPRASRAAAAGNGAFPAPGRRSFRCAVGALRRPAVGRATALRSRLPRERGGSAAS